MEHEIEKIGRFKLDITALKKDTVLSPQKFEFRLSQIKQGGFVKSEAVDYLLGRYLLYRYTEPDVNGNGGGRAIYAGSRECAKMESS